MDDKWLELANKMAEAARAGLAKDRERLKEIPAEPPTKARSIPKPTTRFGQKARPASPSL
jgi:hypothetical protein